MATKKTEVLSALALCAGSFDGARAVPAGAVVEGVPPDVAQLHAGWLDAAPAAVDAAKAAGAEVLQYAE